MQGETADRILRSAHALIADHGYSAFSYADIAESVKVRKASIHHHFATKATLVVAVLKRHRERLMQDTDALNEQVADPLDRLKMYIRYWENCIEGKGETFCIAALLAAELPTLPPEVQVELQKHFEHLSAWIAGSLKQGVKGGSIRLLGTPKNEAQCFMALVHGAMISARAYRTCEVFKTVTAGAILRISAQSR